MDSGDDEWCRAEVLQQQRWDDHRANAHQVEGRPSARFRRKCKSNFIIQIKKSLHPTFIHLKKIIDSEVNHFMSSIILFRHLHLEFLNVYFQDENTDDTVMNESSGDRGSEPEPEPEPEFELENEPGSAPEPVEMDSSEQSEELENIGADVTTSFGWKGTSNESDREADDRNLDEEYDSDEYSEPFYRI